MDSARGTRITRTTASCMALLKGLQMQLTPPGKDRLLVAIAALVARKRLERGVRRNHPEAIALITEAVVEGARDGCSVTHLMQTGAKILSRNQVMTASPR